MTGPPNLSTFIKTEMMYQNLPTVVLFLLLTGTLLGQRQVKEEIPAGNASRVQLQFGYADVEISTWAGSQVVISGTVSINEGENDDSFMLETTQSGDVLSVETYIRNIDELPRMITVLKNGKKYRFRKEGKNKKEIYQVIKEELGDGSYQSWNEGVETDIKLQIRIPENKSIRIESEYGDVEITGVAADLRVRNTYGHIIAALGTEIKSRSVDLLSTYNFVDIGVAENLGLDLELDSDYGKIFTDLDIDIDPDRSEKKSFANRIVGKLNQGGTGLKAKATYKNIYLRKSS